jgi:hypothetical protein
MSLSCVASPASNAFFHYREEMARGHVGHLPGLGAWGKQEKGQFRGFRPDGFAETGNVRYT